MDSVKIEILDHQSDQLFFLQENTMDHDQTLPTPDDDISLTELRVWGEFGAWCAFVMAPIIWWLQGASVSTDQFVVRTGLIAISFLVGLGLRIWAIMQPCSLSEQSKGVTPPSNTGMLPNVPNPSPDSEHP